LKNNEGDNSQDKTELNCTVFTVYYRNSFHGLNRNNRENRD